MLERACGYVADTVAVVERARAAHGHDPAEGSQVATEQAELDGRAYEHHLNATSLAWAQLAAAEDHLVAMAALVRQPQTIFSIYTLARTIAELSARSAWLLEPDIGPRARAERGLHQRMYGLQEQGNLPYERVQRHARERRRELLRLAQAEGLTTSRRNKPPAATQLVAEAMGVAGSELGTMTYKLLSAFTHGTSYALHSLVASGTAEETATEGLSRARVGTDAGREALVMAMAYLPYSRAVRRQLRLYGWTSAQVQASLAYTKSEIVRFVQAPPGGGSDEASEEP